MAELTYGYENIKGFDRRSATETKKINDLRTAFEKIKGQLETERKVYCIDMKKNLDAYAKQNQIECGNFNRIVLDLVGKLEELDSVYEETIKHIENVAIASLS